MAGGHAVEFRANVGLLSRNVVLQGTSPFSQVTVGVGGIEGVVGMGGVGGVQRQGAVAGCSGRVRWQTQSARLRRVQGARVRRAECMCMCMCMSSRRMGAGGLTLWLSDQEAKARCMEAFRSEHSMKGMKKKSSSNWSIITSHSFGSWGGTRYAVRPARPGPVPVRVPRTYSAWRLGASGPVPPVRTARRRLVRVARTYSTEAPGRTCQHR